MGLKITNLKWKKRILELIKNFFLIKNSWNFFPVFLYGLYFFSSANKFCPFWYQFFSMIQWIFQCDNLTFEGQYIWYRCSDLKEWLRDSIVFGSNEMPLTMMMSQNDVHDTLRAFDIQVNLKLYFKLDSTNHCHRV